MYLWFGSHDAPPDSDAAAPACPYGDDPINNFHGGTDIVAPPDCIPCTCGPSIGACELPSKMTAHDVICQDLGQPHKDVPFDAPPGWDGACSNMDPVPAGSGVKSVSIGPVAVKQEKCYVGPPEPARLELQNPYFGIEAFTCHGQGWEECNGDPDSICIRDRTPPPKFHLCISTLMEDDCSSLPWTEKHLFYKYIVDHRDCSACTCGPPMGSGCAAEVSIDTDSACKTLQSGNVVTSDPNFCVNVPPGVALGSKSATPPIYFPGVCTPGGGVPNGGTAEGIVPTTFCCIPMIP